MSIIPTRKSVADLAIDLAVIYLQGIILTYNKDVKIYIVYLLLHEQISLFAT